MISHARMEIINVSKFCRPSADDNHLLHQREVMIEEFAYEWFNAKPSEAVPLDWSYLPIWWTNFDICSRNQKRWLKKLFGIGSRRAKKLNRVVDRRVGSSRFPVFTVAQHDDGIHIHKALSPRDDILVFSAGGTGDIPIALLCERRPYVQRERDLLMSFKGAIRHPVHDYPFRLSIEEKLGKLPGIKIFDTYSCTSNGVEGIDFIELMQRSEFSLCPRGFGATSFRLFESITQSSIPIYVHDGKPWLPYADEIDWSKFCVLTHFRDLENLHSRILSISPQAREDMRRVGQEVLGTHFSMEGTMRYISRKLGEYSGRSVAEVRQGLSQPTFK